MKKSNLSPGQKAKRTGIWAKTMTKWLISHSSKGRKKWQFVSFEGKNNGESTGIVDFIAIRRNHKKTDPPLKCGDLFEVFLIQVKGGSARMPSASERKRLNTVGKFYRVDQILLATWIKGKSPTFRSLHKDEWSEAKDPKEIFR